MHVPMCALALLLPGLCVVSAVDILEHGRPALWEKAAARLDEWPQVDGVSVADPWDYLQRLSLYKLLINNTQEYMGSMGDSPNDHPLWGLPMQLAWKLKSGRLVDPTGATACGQEGDPLCVSAQSWWACVNYYQAVIPFLAALHSGFIGASPTVAIKAPVTAQEMYCSSYAGCSAQHSHLMAKWEKFFQTLKSLQESEMSDAEKKDQILGAMWDAQQASLQTSSECKELTKHYSTKEVSFGRTWLNCADFVAATRFQPSIEESRPFMTPLPSRVLKEGDKPPNIEDLNSDENHTLYIFSWMDTMNTFLGGTLKKMWSNAMCSETSREKGRKVLHSLVSDSKFALTGLMSIITEMSSSC